MNKRDSKLLDLLIDEVFGVSKNQTDVAIGLAYKWSKCFITEAIAPVGSPDRYKYIVTIWATPDGWVYGSAGTHKGGRAVSICSEAEFNKALWAGNAHRLPGLSKLACMIN